MKINFIKPKEKRNIAKLTVHKTGKLGISKQASKMMGLPKYSYAKFGYGEDGNFYMAIHKEKDSETFNISKAGNYYYILAKSLLTDIEINFNSKNTTIFDIDKTKSENIYKLNKRVLTKRNH